MAKYFVSKRIGLQIILATENFYIFPPQMSIVEAILAANGAIAARNLQRLYRRQFGTELNGCAMAIAIVPDFVTFCRISHCCGWIQGEISMQESMCRPYCYGLSEFQRLMN